MALADADRVALVAATCDAQERAGGSPTEDPAPRGAAAHGHGAAGPRLARLGTVAGLAALVGVALACRRAGVGLTSRSLKRPFRLYEGGKDMPDRADQYDGINDTRPVKVVDKDGAVSVFVIGDWGATLPNHCTFPCETDQDAQTKLAAVMQERASKTNPQYVLNAGDNFYVEGLQHSCDAPPNDDQDSTIADFTSGWVDMYGPVAEIPWLGVLGNHDYGGWRFDKGWPQQIGYSFINHNWILPARYYTKRIHHPGFYIDYFMFDSNAFDAKGFEEENQDHNICSDHNSDGVGACGSNGGMPSIDGCKEWFWDSHKVQKKWVEKQMAASDAQWKVIVTHFPCGYETAWYKMLKKEYGLDLVLTGHRHQQELWWSGTSSEYVRAFMDTTGWDSTAPQCVVSGGGGGIVSQKFEYADYGPDLAWYGFFDLTIKKDSMLIELIDWEGSGVGNVTIYPHGSKKAEELQKHPIKSKAKGICEDYCGDGGNPWEKVCSWGSDPWMSCGSCPECTAHSGKQGGGDSEGANGGGWEHSGKQGGGDSEGANGAEEHSVEQDGGDSEGANGAEEADEAAGGSANFQGSKEADEAAGGSADSQGSKEKDQTKDMNCESYCGDRNNPWDKVCSWMSCGSCPGCSAHSGKQGGGDSEGANGAEEADEAAGGSADFQGSNKDVQMRSLKEAREVAKVASVIA